MSGPLERKWRGYEIFNKKELGNLCNSIQAFQWMIIPRPNLRFMPSMDSGVNDS